MKFLFGDIVVVNGNEIGVVVTSWWSTRFNTYDYGIYNRMMDGIEHYLEKDVERYLVRHKYLNEEEMGYQWGD